MKTIKEELISKILKGNKVGGNEYYYLEAILENQVVIMKALEFLIGKNTKEF